MHNYNYLNAVYWQGDHICKSKKSKSSWFGSSRIHSSTPVSRHQSQSAQKCLRCFESSLNNKEEDHWVMDQLKFDTILYNTSVMDYIIGNARIRLWSPVMRVHFSQAYRKVDNRKHSRWILEHIQIITGCLANVKVQFVVLVCELKLFYVYIVYECRLVYS